MILVPTLELGVQITLLAYKLFGGNPSSGRVPGDGANMFRYSGPRGVKARDVACSDDGGAFSTHEGPCADPIHSF